MIIGFSLEEWKEHKTEAAEATLQLEQQFDENAQLITMMLTPERVDIEAEMLKEISYTDIKRGVKVTLKPGLRIRFSSEIHKGVYVMHFAEIWEDEKGFRTDCVALTGGTNLETLSPKAMAWLVFSRITQIRAAEKDKDTDFITVKNDESLKVPSASGADSDEDFDFREFAARHQLWYFG